MSRNNRAARTILIPWAACFLLSWSLPGLARVSASSSAVGNAANADRVCATCHQQIYERYEQTPMARASGAAEKGLLTGDFTHAASGIHYRLFLRGKEAFLQYDRSTRDESQILQGEKKLVYYVGSGKRGRTYLFQTDGFWFEAPVNWYAKQGVWDMAPGYGSAKHMPFTLPVDGGCLHCHASSVQPSLPGSRNHFAGAPFLEAGITCESCHGDPSEHLAQAGKGPILNPAKLSPTRRDFVCLQCHLEGDTSVNRLDRSLIDYRPGADLYSDVVYFVRKGEMGSNLRAASEWEALLQSACRRKSGDKLTCTTCHDPHSTPSPEQGVQYYRGKCLGCHSGVGFSKQHHPEQRDCTACHMPREETQDIAHEQVTDHRIQKRPRPVVQKSDSINFGIIPIGGAQADARDLGLAYAQFAQHGNQAAGERAMQLLRQAEGKERPDTRDPELHTELGFLDQMSGDIPAAEREYRLAIHMNPVDATAAGDLAVLLAQSGEMSEAVTLWQSAFQQNPDIPAAGFDLAVGYCKLGDPNSAIRTLQRVVTFSPDDPKAKRLMDAIENGLQSCKSK
ncbi:MAG TPA: tetratricopeptide repeat protein [Acidobacteriaceae bacterium]|nr:tetratricopeptide repeat protein [Acidobacteriaceae bacterium]